MLRDYRLLTTAYITLMVRFCKSHPAGETARRQGDLFRASPYRAVSPLRRLGCWGTAKAAAVEIFLDHLKGMKEL